MSQSPPTSRNAPVPRIFFLLAWVIYVGYLLLSDLPPGPSLLHTDPATLQEAIALSLNFWFVLPVLLPQVAPSLSPTLEALFNITVAWGLLFWGFAIDGRGQKLPIWPFLIGTAFLTNVFYLPWLALRRSQQTPPSSPLTPIERGMESKVLPVLLVGVVILSAFWAAFGRPEFGDWSLRWLDLQQTLSRDRLAYSFAIDLATFWLFQACLVEDDMARRNCENPAMLWLARIVPFFGLAAYLYARPQLALAE